MSLDILKGMYLVDSSNRLSQIIAVANAFDSAGDNRTVILSLIHGKPQIVADYFDDVADGSVEIFDTLAAASVSVALSERKGEEVA